MFNKTICNLVPPKTKRIISSYNTQTWDKPQLRVSQSFFQLCVSRSERHISGGQTGNVCLCVGVDLFLLLQLLLQLGSGVAKLVF